MSGRASFAVKAIVVALVAALCAGLVCAVVTPKFYSDEDGSTVTFSNFYELEDDSVDVLFLGSSHARSSFIPQALYDEYGITSYNLSSSSQSLILSYYWLEEALQSQDPQVVVLDTFKLFQEGSAALNCEESAIWKAMDGMHWGSVKWEAVQAICEEDETQSLVSYLLPNLRYHDRWKELDSGDFLSDEMSEAGELKGYVAYYAYGTNDEDYSPIVEDGSEEAAEMAPLMLEYLDKIVELCDERGIRLVLVKTPTTLQSAGEHEAVAAYAEEHGLDFYDFNEQSIYEELGYDFNADNYDAGHANLLGALKMTDYLGGILQDEFGISAHEDAGWEDSRAFEDMQADYWLAAEEDLDGYLERLQEDAERYSIFIAVRGDAAGALEDSTREALAELGLTEDLGDASSASYCAAIVGGEVCDEQLSSEALDCTGSALGGQLVYEIVSAGEDAGDECSISLDGVEQAQGASGINIVVYDNEQRIVIDSVAFNTASADCSATR